MKSDDGRWFSNNICKEKPVELLAPSFDEASFSDGWIDEKIGFLRRVFELPRSFLDHCFASYGSCRAADAFAFDLRSFSFFDSHSGVS